jgi:anaerobic ribonucleoside-triphosphate reductase
MEQYTCHDCGKSLENDAEYMPYKVGSEIYVKCKECHQKDSVLRNFRSTEVYSRVVGYIRPVQQWNAGKRQEFGDRVEYVVEQAGCATC